MIYGFHAILVRIPKMLNGNFKLILSFTWKYKETKKKIGKVVLKKKNKVEGFMLPNINASYKATLIKTVWPWGKGRQIYQWA